MNTKRLVLAVTAAVAIVAFAAGAFADPITSNTRPVPIDAPSFGDDLQTILNNLGFVGVSAATDQSSVSMWQTVATPPFANTIPLLVVEFLCSAGGNCLSNNFQEFGFFTATDTAGPITRVPIFNGPADAGAQAAIQWLDADTIQIADPFSSGGINTGTFDGIQASFFGFYYQLVLNPFEYSVDALNLPDRRTQAAMLAFQAAPGSDTWVIAFDANASDILGSGGLDYNDLVVKIESIRQASQVPEPATLLLLGVGLGAFSLLARRRN